MFADANGREKITRIHNLRDMHLAFITIAYNIAHGYIKKKRPTNILFKTNQTVGYCLGYELSEPFK